MANKISNYAVINNTSKVVVNIVVWDGDEKQWGPGKGYTTVKIEPGVFCDIDMVYDPNTGSFAYPEGYVRPSEVT